MTEDIEQVLASTGWHRARRRQAQGKARNKFSTAVIPTGENGQKTSKCLTRQRPEPMVDAPSAWSSVDAVEEQLEKTSPSPSKEPSPAPPAARAGGNPKPKPASGRAAGAPRPKSATGRAGSASEPASIRPWEQGLIEERRKATEKIARIEDRKTMNQSKLKVVIRVRPSTRSSGALILTRTRTRTHTLAPSPSSNV